MQTVKATLGNTSPPAVLLTSQMEQSWVVEVAVGIALPYAGVNVFWRLCGHSEYSGRVLITPFYVLWCE